MTTAQVAKMSENGRLWEAMAPILFNEERLRLAKEEVDQVMRMVNALPGQRVLDVGCGIGRHSNELSKLGYKVTGIDVTPSFVAKAQLEAREKKLSTEFLEADMREFIRANSFDLIVSLFTSFGYFQKQDENQLVLSNLFKSLDSGGKLVLQMKAKEVMSKSFVFRDWEEEGNLVMLTERSVSQNWDWIDLRLVFFDGGVREEFKTGMHLYSASELTQMLRTAGFDRVEVFGDFDQSAYDHAAKKTVLVAHKS